MNVLDLLEIVTEREKGGHDFYTRAAEITHDTEGKEMFLRLAQQEMGHFNNIIRLKEALVDLDSQVEYGRLSDADSRIIESIPKSEASGEVTASTSVLDVLQITMQAERTSIVLYRWLERISVDPAVKMMANELVIEEQAHLLMLEVQQAALEKSQSFVAIDELTNLFDFQP